MYRSAAEAGFRWKAVHRNAEAELKVGSCSVMWRPRHRRVLMLLANQQDLAPARSHDATLGLPLKVVHGSGL